MEEKILTLHPEGKTGVRISRQKYEAIREAILAILKSEGAMTFSELGEKMKKVMDGHFEGSVIWYYTTVKLDLEARGMIERLSGSKPPKINLTDKV